MIRMMMKKKKTTTAVDTNSSYNNIYLQLCRDMMVVWLICLLFQVQVVTSTTAATTKATSAFVVIHGRRNDRTVWTPPTTSSAGVVVTPTTMALCKPLRRRGEVSSSSSLHRFGFCGGSRRHATFATRPTLTRLSIKIPDTRQKEESSKVESEREGEKEDGEVSSNEREEDDDDNTKEGNGIISAAKNKINGKLNNGIHNIYQNVEIFMDKLRDYVHEMQDKFKLKTTTKTTTSTTTTSTTKTKEAKTSSSSTSSSSQPAPKLIQMLNNAIQKQKKKNHEKKSESRESSATATTTSTRKEAKTSSSSPSHPVPKLIQMLNSTIQKKKKNNHEKKSESRESSDETATEGNDVVVAEKEEETQVAEESQVVSDQQQQQLDDEKNENLTDEEKKKLLPTHSSRWAICDPSVDLSGTWKPVASEEFKSEYDRYLTNCGEGVLLRKAFAAAIPIGKEIVQQTHDGKELSITGVTPFTSWKRTLITSGSDYIINGDTTKSKNDKKEDDIVNDYNVTTVSFKDPDGDVVNVEAYWIDNGTKHKSFLRGKPRVYDGYFESTRYLIPGENNDKEKDVLVCEATFHPPVEKANPSKFKQDTVTWKFNRVK